MGVLRTVVLYSTGCPKCSVLTKKLKAKNIGYELVDDADKMIAMGLTEVPMLEVDGILKSFKEANDWLEER